jgi:hypothetical protein
MDITNGLIEIISKNVNTNLDEINSPKCREAINNYLEKLGVIQPQKKSDKDISISSENKKKIEKLKKRIIELYGGVTKKFTVPAKVNFVAYCCWTERAEFDIDIDIVDITEPDSKSTNLVQKKYRQEIEKETKEIIKSLDNISKKLGISRKEFFKQYLSLYDP